VSDKPSDELHRLASSITVQMLAKRLDDHLGAHRIRDRDCVLCAVIVAHVEMWRQTDDGSDAILGMWRFGTPLDGDGPDTPLGE